MLSLKKMHQIFRNLRRVPPVHLRLASIASESKDVGTVRASVYILCFFRNSRNHRKVWHCYVLCWSTQVEAIFFRIRKIFILNFSKTLISSCTSFLTNKIKKMLQFFNEISKLSSK